MGQPKELKRRHLGSLINASVHGAKAAAQMKQWALYSTSPKYPGKLIQRSPDGSEVVGTFRDGTFVSEH